MTDRPWLRTEVTLPKEGEEVEVVNGSLDGEHVIQTLVLDRNLWWFPDRSMYVYFAPTLWRPLAAGR